MLVPQMAVGFCDQHPAILMVLPGRNRFEIHSELDGFQSTKSKTGKWILGSLEGSTESKQNAELRKLKLGALDFITGAPISELQSKCRVRF